MKKKLVILFTVVYCLFTLMIWLYPKQEESLEERRKLKQRPTLSVETILTNEFTDNFEAYAQDQFPFRFQSRQMKAIIRYYGLGLFENNKYIKDKGSIIHLESSLNESEITKAGKLFQELKETLFPTNDVYLSIIPDKSYYSSKNLPVMDYEKMKELLLSEMRQTNYIDIKDTLTLDNFYKSDIHWKHEDLLKTSNLILEGMGQNRNHSYPVKTVDERFRGVYYGHSALSVDFDTIASIQSDVFEKVTVSSLDSDELCVFDDKKLSSKDKYNYFLEGPQAILEIENPNANTENDLIIFRDSFGSSITPYFIENYKSITLIDIRYISSSILSDYVQFDDKDILFLYSGNILNSSSMLKK